MDASFEAMPKKCNKEGSTLHNLKHDLAGSPLNTVNLFAELGQIKAKIKSGQSLGVYLAAHYDSSTTNTKPTVQEMASVAMWFYQNDFTPTKINLNACFSAGTPETLVDYGVKYDDNLAIDFCATLVDLLNTDTIDLICLKGCMVAGYRAQVVLFNPTHDHFKSGNPQEWTKSLKDKTVGNLTRENSSYSRLHPKNDPALNAKLQNPDFYATTNIKKISKKGDSQENYRYYPERSITVSEFDTPTDNIKTIKFSDLFKNDQKLMAYVKALLQYIMIKKVFRFDEHGNISQISIADYSENPDIKEMIIAMETFNQNALAENNAARYKFRVLL
jgi:hypothetical protein